MQKCMNGEKQQRVLRLGFTLLEVLVGIVVMTVAVAIFISLYTHALALDRASRCSKVASALAEAQLAQLHRQPRQYDWSSLRAAAPGELVEVALQGEQPGTAHAFPPPTAQAVVRTAAARDEDLYSRFGWRMFARRPREEAGYVEVTVSVHWQEEGKEKAFTLTSSVPRTLVEGAA